MSFARRAPGRVPAAYLCGSRARGTAMPSSDVDVGVVPDRRTRSDPRARFDLRVDPTGQLIRALSRNDVGAVILDEAPPPLAAAVVAQGTFAFCRDARRLREFVRGAQLVAADPRPFLRRMEERLLATSRAAWLNASRARRALRA